LSALKWNNIDALLNANAFAVGQSPGEGPGCKGGVQGLPASTGGTNCVFAANNFTNAVTTIGTPHFFSQYLPIDFILNNQIKTPLARLPLNVLGEFIVNPEAKSHPLGSTGAIRADLGSQNKAYQIDVSIGQQRNKNDIQVGYAWNRIEQDAVLSPFVESDQRTQTNVVQNRIYGLWRVRSNTTASYTYWFGRTLNTSLQNATRSGRRKAEPYAIRSDLHVLTSGHVDLGAAVTRRRFLFPLNQSGLLACVEIVVHQIDR
jgi:hypothetical protein